MTPRRIASQQRTQVPHSATGDSRKDALWGVTLTERRTLRMGLIKGRILHAGGGCVESLFSPVCVHSCVPTVARATGRGPRVPRCRRPHGPRDAKALGPEVHTTGAVTHPPTRAHEASSEPIVIENSQAGCANASNGGINPADSTPRASSNAANQAGSSYFPLPHAITFDEQLPQMERRGLVVEDRDFAISKLQDLSYYRLCD